MRCNLGKLRKRRLLSKLTERFWGGFWPFYLLLPFSWLYRLFIVIRRGLYRCHGCKTFALSVPVIVVGNLTLGGTGKTPFVIALTQVLQKNGVKVGIISRGYGGQYDGLPQAVDAGSDPRLVGDESVLMAIKTGAPIVIAHDRVKAGRYLLSQVACDVVISDDGLQHEALHRDLEIVLHHPERVGNKQCLPAGPLREPLSRLKAYNHVLVWKKDYHHEFDPIRPIEREDSALDLAQPIHAIAGISQPERFFSALRSLGISTIHEHAFPDHHLFQYSDLMFDTDLPLVMTEKDMVKCKQLGLRNAYVLPIRCVIDSDFLMTILDFIELNKT